MTRATRVSPLRAESSHDASGSDGARGESSIGTTSSARACVAPRTTSGAWPASCASSQREAQRHQWSPGTSPPNPYSGRGVDRSLPTDLRELEELGRHDDAHGVAADVLRAGRAAAVAVEAGERLGRAGRSFPPTTLTSGSGVIAGAAPGRRSGRQVARVVRVPVRPGNMISSMRSRTSGVRTTSAAPSWLSRCSMVRGPMIAEVTAGWLTTNAIARWTSEIPASSARSGELIGGLELALVRRQRHVVAPREALGPRARRGLGSLAVAAREPAACERAPRDHAHAVALAGREHVALDAPDEHGVGRLLAAEPLAAASLCDPLGLDDRFRRERRAAEIRGSSRRGRGRRARRASRRRRCRARGGAPGRCRSSRCSGDGGSPRPPA